MTYNDVITLAEVKNYLRIDDTFTKDDAALERMVRSALQLVEKYTAHVLHTDTKTYHAPDGQSVEVFDYPIMNLPTDVITLNFAGKVEFCTNKVTLDVGYQSKTDVPDTLIDAALEIIEVWYYKHEKNTNTGLIPDSIKDALFAFKRDMIVA